MSHFWPECPYEQGREQNDVFSSAELLKWAARLDAVPLDLSDSDVLVALMTSNLHVLHGWNFTRRIAEFIKI